MSNKQISKLEETLNKLFSGSEYNMVDVSAKAVTARRALATGEISKDLDIDTTELSLATTLSASVMIETLQRQSKYLSDAIQSGAHKMTSDAAMLGVKEE